MTNILILGAGITGITTAYVLHKRGYKVTVIERNPDPASECSYANGGQLSYSHSKPWANPAFFRQLPKWLTTPYSPLVVRRLDWHGLRWMTQFLLSCRQSISDRTSNDIYHLAQYSKACLHQLIEETNIRFDYTANGTLQCYRNPYVLKTALRQAQLQQNWGCEFQYVENFDQCVAIEPSLSRTTHPFIGGIFYPQDASGDAQKFTCQLAAFLEQNGVTFHYNTPITKLIFDKSKLHEVQTAKGSFTADHYMMCLGAYSPQLLAPLKLPALIYPLKGYSLTVPLCDNDLAPHCSLTDDANKIVVSRLGQKLRFAGTAEFGGYDHFPYSERVSLLKQHAVNLFPQLSQIDQSESWACLRPSTPTNLPIIGRSPLHNLYYNTGHGTLGWTLAAGSAYKIADILELHTH